MSLSVPNTGATAVEASRYAVITQDRLLTSLNCRPMVGRAVATMVWSSAARNIVSSRLIRMVRTSSGVSGARGASDGASESSMTSVVICESSRAKSSGNVVWSAESCRSNLFISDVIFFYTALTARMESLFRALFTGETTRPAAPPAHGCIPRGHLRVYVIDQRQQALRVQVLALKPSLRLSVASSVLPASAAAP